MKPLQRLGFAARLAGAHFFRHGFRFFDALFVPFAHRFVPAAFAVVPVIYFGVVPDSVFIKPRLQRLGFAAGFAGTHFDFFRCRHFLPFVLGFGF